MITVSKLTFPTEIIRSKVIRRLVVKAIDKPAMS